MGVMSSDNTMARSERHVPFVPLQLASHSRLIRIKQGKSVSFGHNVRIF